MPLYTYTAYYASQLVLISLAFFDSRPRDNPEVVGLEASFLQAASAEPFWTAGFIAVQNTFLFFCCWKQACSKFGDPSKLAIGDNPSQRIYNVPALRKLPVRLPVVWLNAVRSVTAIKHQQGDRCIHTTFPRSDQKNAPEQTVPAPLRLHIVSMLCKQTYISMATVFDKLGGAQIPAVTVRYQVLSAYESEAYQPTSMSSTDDT
ncbi:hypothetical protein F4604DRAFT_1683666 [Suillus subluteus]|nr:hypothetical protein F4604DRAFT_1683666 [Suillus subluteus]